MNKRKLEENDKRKRVVLDSETANEVMNRGISKVEWDNQTIVVKRTDIPDSDECCFISAHMIDSSKIGYEECSKCGRQYNEKNELVKFTSRANEVIAYVPHSEFIAAEE